MTTSANEHPRPRLKPYTRPGRPAPPQAIANIIAWAEADRIGRDNGLLLRALPETWIGGITSPPTLRQDSNGRYATLHRLAKPHGDGDTHRDLDIEGLALTLALFIPGGRLSIEPQGPDNNVYYPRVEIYAPTATKPRRRVNLMPVLAGTPGGDRAREADYHSLRRCHLQSRSSKRGELASVNAMETIIGQSIERFREVCAAKPKAFPPSFDAARFAALLETLRGRLMALPLGTVV